MIRLTTKIILAFTMSRMACNVAGQQQKELARSWDKELDGPWYVSDFFYGRSREVAGWVFFIRSGVICDATNDGNRLNIDEFDASVDK